MSAKETMMLSMILALVIVQQEGRNHEACSALARDLQQAGREIPNVNQTTESLYIKNLILPDKIVESAFLAHRSETEHSVKHAMQFMVAESDWPFKDRSTYSAKKDADQMRDLYALVLFLDLYYELQQYEFDSDFPGPSIGWLKNNWIKDHDGRVNSLFWEYLENTPRLRQGIQEWGARGGEINRNLALIYESWKSRAARARYRN